MKQNEATWDRVVRVVLGLTIVSLAFLGPKTPWGFVGFLPLITGLVGFCPAYRLFGVATCQQERAG